MREDSFKTQEEEHVRAQQRQSGTTSVSVAAAKRDNSIDRVQIRPRQYAAPMNHRWKPRVGFPAAAGSPR